MLKFAEITALVPFSTATLNNAQNPHSAYQPPTHGQVFPREDHDRVPTTRAYNPRGPEAAWKDRQIWEVKPVSLYRRWTPLTSRRSGKFTETLKRSTPVSKLRLQDLSWSAAV